jgi:hypothetical protein
LKKKADEKYSQRLGQNLRLGLVSSVLGSGAVILWLGMPTKDDVPIEGENVAMAYVRRAWESVMKWFEVSVLC